MTLVHAALFHDEWEQFLPNPSHQAPPPPGRYQGPVSLPYEHPTVNTDENNHHFTHCVQHIILYLALSPGKIQTFVKQWVNKMLRQSSYILYFSRLTPRHLFLEIGSKWGMGFNPDITKLKFWHRGVGKKLNFAKWGGGGLPQAWAFNTGYVWYKDGEPLMSILFSDVSVHWFISSLCKVIIVWNIYW